MAYTRVAGVYEIRNTLDDKVYIGSSIELDKRIADHRRKLARGKHCSAHLQAAWDKHGACNFTFKKLLVCDTKDILFYEQRLIDGYGSMDPEQGYNKRLVAQSNAGMKHSDETKRRVSASMMGRVVSAETRAKISASNMGGKRSDQSKERMSVAHKGRKLSADQIERRGKLTRAKVAEIRALRLATGKTQLQLSVMFGVSRESIGELLRGETWTCPESGYNKILDSKERKERHALARPRGEAHHNFGKSWATEAMRKAAAIANRRPKSEDGKLNMSAAKKGKKMPAGFSEKMRLAGLGKTQSAETIRKKAEARRSMSYLKANEIRASYLSGVRLTSRLAEVFSVSKKCVRSVLAGQTWAEHLVA